MNLLLDTHIVLWWILEPKKLTKKEYDTIENHEHHFYISAASIWEMSIKHSINKLKIPTELESELHKNDFKVLPIDFELALSVKDLPPHHMDPFDRMIIATAQQYDLPLITHDSIFKKYALTCFEG